MKAPNIISRLFPFFKSLNIETNESNEEEDNFEFTHAKLGINFKPILNAKRTSKSLVDQMYTEENEILFI